jgi:hypothetical protein
MGFGWTNFRNLPKNTGVSRNYTAMKTQEKKE